MSDADPMLAGKNMLVVDDEPMLAFDLADLLQLHGANIVGTCMSVDESRAQIDRDDRIDCALLDIQVGDQEIWPVARALKERGTPFVFVSAVCGIRELPEEFADRPCVPKPLDRSKLRDALARALSL